MLKAIEDRLIIKPDRLLPSGLIGIDVEKTLLIKVLYKVLAIR